MTRTVTIDANGIQAPTYNDVLEDLKDGYRTIYGSDTYLEADSQDGQFLAIMALSIKEANDMAVAIYNVFSPSTAQGVGLSSVVKINGIERKTASFSTVDLLCVGVAGTVIVNGTAVDELDNTWILPPNVTIPFTGEIIVTATALNPGYIFVQAGLVDHIGVPTPGWQTVTNPNSSVPGAPIEIDAELRRRQAKSTAFPAQAIIESVYAGVANVVGVQRLLIYENWTGITDINGVPSHSISVVVEGGDALEIATAIANRKTPGTGTYGDITNVVIDQNGVPDRINFFELVEVPINVLVYINPLTGYLSSTAGLIKNSAAYWLTNQAVGTNSYLSRLISALNLSGTAALEATGLTQVQLDNYSSTFSIEAVAQASLNMIVSGGPYIAGVTSVNIVELNNIQIGSTCYLTQDNTGLWRVIITGISGLTLTFEDYPIPAGQQISSGSFVYLQDDVLVSFRQATICDPLSDIITVGG